MTEIIMAEMSKMPLMILFLVDLVLAFVVIGWLVTYMIIWLFNRDKIFNGLKNRHRV